MKTPFKLLNRKTPNFNNTFELIFLSSLLLIILSIVFWSLNKGIIMFDEGYFLNLLRYPDSSLFSTWSIIFHKLLPANLILLRHLTILIILISVSTFSFGIHSYCKHVLLKNINYWIILILSLIGYFSFALSSHFIPYTNVINLWIILFSSGILLYSLSLERKINYVGIIVSGFLSGLLFFIQITTVSIIFIQLLFIFLHNKRLLVFYLLGLLSLYITYFTLIQSPLEYYDFFTSSQELLKYDKGHGIKAIIKWCIPLFNSFLVEIIPVSLLGYLLLNKCSDLKRHVYILIILSLVGFLTSMIFDSGIFNFVYTLKYYNGLYSSKVYYMLIVTLLIFFFNQTTIKTKEAYLIFYFLLLSFLSVVGTDVPFFSKTAFGTMSIVLPAIYILLYSKKQSILKIVFFFLIFTTTINFILNTFRSGWTGQLLSQQTELVATNNCTLYLDKRRVENYNFINTNIAPQSIVLISSPHILGYVYLSNFNMPYCYYHLFVDILQEKLNNYSHDAIKQFQLIELEKYPFTDKFWKLLDTYNLTPESYQKLNNKEVTLYLPKIPKEQFNQEL